jgi:hypothetical protein
MNSPFSERATTMEEYRGLIHEALDEIDDLRASIEYDEEYMEGALALVDPIATGLKDLLKSIDDGDYQFGQGDLAFMDVVRRANNSLLPFKFLFTRIERTHKEGLNQEG